jgi:hypothetical protein
MSDRSDSPVSVPAEDAEPGHTKGPIAMQTPTALYHATPLHYLPHIAATGALWSKSVLAGMGIAPRRSACRRDRMLGLADYVHFYPQPGSPLLADKIAKGFPHALLVFDAERVLSLAGTGVIPYNTKSWRHREEFQPIEDSAQIAVLLAAHADGAHPSLEVLARYAVGLDALRLVAFIADEERSLAEQVLRELRLAPKAPLVVDRDLFPNAGGYRPDTLPSTSRYFQECRQARTVAVPPGIPFD